MLRFTEFKRSHCARTVTQLMSPTLIDSDSTVLPYHSVLHFIADTDTGVSPTHPLVRASGRVFVHHVEELSGEAGSPRKKAIPLEPRKREYFKQAQAPIARSRDLVRSLSYTKAAVAFDYSLVEAQYVYPPSRTVEMDKLSNRLTTLYSYLSTGTEESAHIVALPLPETIPTLSELNRLPNPIPVSRHVHWMDIGRLFIRELWLASTDIDHPLHSLKHDTLIAWMESGQLSFFHVNDFLTWAIESPKEACKYLLSFLSRVLETRTVADTDAIQTERSEEETLEDDATSVDSILQVTSGLYPESAGPVGEPHINRVMETLGSEGMLSSAEQRRLAELAVRYKSLPNPVGEGTLEDLITRKPDTFKIDSTKENLPNRPAVLDKSMLRSTLKEFDRRYVKEALEADVAAAVLSVQNAGVLVKDYVVEERADAINHYRQYTVDLVPIAGKPSKLTFKLPVVNEDGTYVVAGVQYRLDHQKFDMPIRKVAPDKVSLASYFGKIFVTRNPKAVNNYSRWILGKITKAAMDLNDASVTDVVYTTKPLPREPLPRTFTAIAREVGEFTSGQYRFRFIADDWDKTYGESLTAKALKAKLVPCGHPLDRSKGILALSMDGTVHLVTKGSITALDNLVTLINPTWGEGPIEFADINVYGKAVPTALALGYLMGLDKLIAALKIPHRWVDKTARINLEPHETRVRFQDESLVFDTRHAQGTIVLSGLRAVKGIASTLPASEFNRKGVYGEVLSTLGIGRHILRELDLMQDMFIDPITLELLSEMGEPTEFIPLILRAAELLTTDEHTDEMDSSQMRIRGYERLSGFVYNQIVQAVREQRSAGNPRTAQVSLRPNAVWDDILKDPATMLVEESNPIHNLKEKESVTYTGQGGRSAKTMVKRTRVFHPNDMGTISETTPDSAKVAIRTYMTPNAKVNSLRGTTDRFDFDVDGVSSLVSTTTLMSPAGTTQDPKRSNLSSVQQSSMVSARGATLTPVRTGYEQVIADRTGDNFAYLADREGTVTKVTRDNITVEYEDGEKVTLPLGIRHGKAAGAVLPHEIVTDLKVGDRVDEGYAVTWNAHYFQRDRLNPNGVSMKGGVIAKVAFMENGDTLEDGCAISPALYKSLSTPISKMKTVLVRFDQALSEVVEVGGEVDLDTPLCIIEEAELAAISQGDDALLGLSKLANQTPKAGFVGKVSRREVIYYGNPDDMHPSLAELVKADTAQRKREAKYKGALPATTGEISESTFIGGQKVTPNTLAITFYMDHDITAAVGDKAVFDNALKTIIGRVMEGRNETASGEPLDAIFGYQSVANRILYSCIIVGATNKALRGLNAQVVKAYRS